ncbi:hypothetical protein J7F03_28450 [Streptomyces sp. ISL-43]|uniref:hypothetical protein n=1 Tax=Streptomyces sp. ISL-43 TaxID=2819183 RepID=UPI001BE7E86F|nr:hypothetical protein [Streptomyces sp. ISL-43]MBT2450936.1 hypothetical protein [Streptomyces sp. ISL-43]
MTTTRTTDRPAADVAGPSGVPGGAWPPAPYTEEFLIRARAERARRELTLGSIRASLEDQPSARAVRTAARNWAADVLALAEEIATEKTEQHVDHARH